MKRFFSFCDKSISACFAAITILIALVLLCFSWISYCFDNDFVLPNIVSLLITLILSFLFYQSIKRLHLDSKTFYAIIIPTFCLLFIAQVIMLNSTYFHTGWDVLHLDMLSDAAAQTGSVMNASNIDYLSYCSNNVLLVALLTLFKSIPVIGEHYLIFLAFNALLVNLACLLTCLTIKQLVSRKAALLSILLLAPLIIFSPWIIIPYSDTLSIIFPVLVFFIYLRTNKRWYHYFFIVFLSFLGFFIKPTVIIALIAIAITELIQHPRPLKSFFKKPCLTTSLIPAFCGLLLAFSCNFATTKYIDFHPLPTVPASTFIHFLAMGENEETCGRYLAQDVQEARNGKVYEFKKFLRRLFSRNPIQTISFFTQKLLVNYNDGTFAWSGEGEDYDEFYYNLPDHSGPLGITLTNYFYKSRPYYDIFTQVSQTLWIFVICGCVFAIKTQKSKQLTALKLIFIGLFFFVMLFEARARYLFCCAPIIVILSVIGYRSLYHDILPGLIQRAKSLSQHRTE